MAVITLRLSLIFKFIPYLPVLSFAHHLSAQSPSSEYSTTNPRGRLRVRIQVWGDVNKPGFYNVPDTTSLVDLMGYLGGPKGHLKNMNLYVRRNLKEDGSFRRQIAKFTGDDLLTNDEAAALILENDDIVYVEAGLGFADGISLVNATTGVISSVILTYFLIQERF